MNRFAVPLLALVFACGIGVGWLVRDSKGSSGSDITERKIIAASITAAGRTTNYRVYSVVRDGEPDNIGPLPRDASESVVLTFGASEIQIYMTPVE